MGCDDVVFELACQALAEGNGLGGDVFGRGKVGEEEQHGEGIVKIAQGVGEGGIALLDDVVELDLGHEVALQTRSIAGLSATEGATNLLCDGLVLAELGKQRLVEKVVDVLGIVEGGLGCGALGDLFLVARFAGVDALEDTQPAEVGQRDLELLDGAGAGDVVFGCTGGAWEGR